MNYSVELEHVEVSYRVRARLEQMNPGGAIKAANRIQVSKNWVEVQALSNINLKLAQGDRLALIGTNGAGKTTLLRVLASIIPPTRGRVEVRGRISPLLSITLGLDNEATGYENIHIRARILGVPQELAHNQADEIAEFSELGDYLSLPLKSYSAGMRLRLAFGIATAFSPGVLVMDEWLSAGDAEFQKKAKQRLEHMITSSGVFVFASQSRQLQRAFCSSGLVLDGGTCGFLGPIEEAYEFSDNLLANTNET